MSLKDFVPIQKLGEGSFATVYKARRLTDQQIYAIKKIKMNNLDSRVRDNALNEVRLLASLSSPYIINYHQAFFDDNYDILSIVMQYANEGDLSQMIRKHRENKKFISQSQIWKVLLHILNALNILHSKNILHRDIKSENIFIVEDVYKIGDMNVSKVNRNGLVLTQTGTPYYSSPEIWNDQAYNEKCDIWSLGCVIYEMAALRTPFMGRTMQDLYKNISYSNPSKIPLQYSNQLNEVIRLCLTKDYHLRPSVTQLLKNQAIRMYANIYIDYSMQTLENQTQLLKTIHMPKNKKQLKKQLPKPNYNSDKYNGLGNKLDKENEQITAIIKDKKNRKQNKIQQNLIEKDISFIESDGKKAQINIQIKECINNIEENNQQKYKQQINNQIIITLKDQNNNQQIPNQLNISKNKQFVQQHQQIKPIQTELKQIQNKILISNFPKDDKSPIQTIRKLQNQKPIAHFSAAISHKNSQNRVNIVKKMIADYMNQIKVNSNHVIPAVLHHHRDKSKTPQPCSIRKQQQDFNRKSPLQHKQLGIHISSPNGYFNPQPKKRINSMPRTQRINRKMQSDLNKKSTSIQPKNKGQCVRKATEQTHQKEKRESLETKKKDRSTDTKQRDRSTQTKQRERSAQKKKDRSIQGKQKNRSFETKQKNCVTQQKPKDKSIQVKHRDKEVQLKYRDKLIDSKQKKQPLQKKQKLEPKKPKCKLQFLSIKQKIENAKKKAQTESIRCQEQLHRGNKIPKKFPQSIHSLNAAGKPINLPQPEPYEFNQESPKVCQKYQIPNANSIYYQAESNKMDRKYEQGRIMKGNVFKNVVEKAKMVLQRKSLWKRNNMYIHK